MALKFIPQMFYNGTLLKLSQPIKVWSPEAIPAGGSAVSDAGVPEAFIVRRDQRCKFDMRFLETEWAAVDQWLNWGQNANAFDFYFNQNDNSSMYTVYLDEPTPGNGEVTPTREPFLKVFTIPIVIRTTDRRRFTITVF